MAVHLYNNSGSVHLVIDVVGYFRTGVNDESRRTDHPAVEPVPCPRHSQGELRERPPRPVAGRDLELPPFVENVVSNGIWVGEQDAVIMNFTATELTFPARPATRRT